MNNMMYATGPNFGIPMVGILHLLGALSVLVGIVFLVTWGIKKLNQHQLRNAGFYLIFVGVVICFLAAATTAAWGLGIGGHKCDMMDGKKCSMMEKMGDGGMMKMMMDKDGMMDMDDDDDMMDMGADPMDHSMNDMTKMLEGKTGDDFDRAFIEMMVPHHQGAIDMARAALQSAGHAEIKAMAEDILEAQQAEIDQMHRWQVEWGYAG